MLSVQILLLAFLVNLVCSASISSSESSDGLSSKRFTPASNVNMTWVAEVDKIVPYDVSFYYPSPYADEVLSSQDVAEYTRNIQKSIVCPIYKQILKHNKNVPNEASSSSPTNFTHEKDENGTYYANRFGGTKMPIVLTDNLTYYVGVIVSSAVEFPILITSRLIKDLPNDVEEKINAKIAELQFNLKPTSVINSRSDCKI